MPLIKCDLCGKKKMSRFEKTRFCSRSCSVKYWNDEMIKARTEKRRLIRNK